MLSTELTEAAVELGRALRQAPAVTAYAAATASLDGDPAAQGWLTDLRDLQTGLARAQQAGLTPSQEQIDKFRLCQAAVRMNEPIMAHLRATSDVKVFLPEVARAISAVLGTDYAKLVAPTSC
jgi:cell fate (sporulation/competence/biofilm development) regulator YlbF (YheA/YmcA/DUF963 family)